ncbi:MAG: dTDP-4-dehydrorhamnose reductase, partial [Gammaproteobacteria bacterium]|nr:dTDP-4-dehydrorhamnose reductase [Gammaproteobacteria bacterium]
LLNADLPAALADHCEQLNSLLIHYSTDFVFDGTNDKPYQEDDSTQPLSIYGRSKLAGEKAIQTACCPSLILRTSWVYGRRGSNFLLTMIRLAKERESISVVDDQIGAPSYCRDIALATIKLCNSYKSDPNKFKIHSRIYNLTCSGKTSWFGFAKAIFEQISDKESLVLDELKAITSEQYPVAATRPAYSVLDCSKIYSDFGIEMPDWEESLIDCLKRYYQ